VVLSVAEGEGSAGGADDMESEAATGGLLTAAGGADEVSGAFVDATNGESEDEVGGASVDATNGESGDDVGVCTGVEEGVVEAWATAGVAAGVVLGVASFAGGESDCANQ